MDKRSLYQIFTEVIKCAVNDSELPKSVKQSMTGEVLARLFYLSDFHGVAYIAAYALKKEGIPLPKKFNEKYHLAKQRFSVIGYETERIKDLFERKEIPYVLLKGAVVKDMYDNPFMRPCYDIDVLIKKEDVQRAVNAVVENMGGVKGGKAEHDISILTDSGINVELHYSFGNAFGGEYLLSLAWDKKQHTFGNFGYIMPHDILNAYLTFHAANHFKNGGPGIKAYMDFYVLNKNWGFSAETGKEILEKIGLSVFAAKSYEVSAKWFNGEQIEINPELENYIIEGGIYGTLKQKTELDYAFAGKNYYRHRLFLPLSRMKIRYRTLEKYPFLLPYYQVKRWFSLLKKKRGRSIKAELEYKNAMPKESAEKLKNLIKELEL